MRIISLCLPLLAACGTPRPVADAAPTEAAAPPTDGLLRAGLESPLVLASGDGLAWLSVVVTPPAAPAAPQPLAVALVVDTSGSMEGEKIEHARFAARALLGALRPGDQVAIVRFDDAPHLVSPRVRLGAPGPTPAAGQQATQADPQGADLAHLQRLVEALPANGSTALFGGVEAGLRALEGSGPGVRRLLLISDGQANVGHSSPEAILAHLPPTEAPVTLSALGVGTDYDVGVLSALARRGAGGLHHLTDPVQLAGILQAELARARAVGGREAVVTLTPRPGVEVVAAAPGLRLERAPDGTVRIPVGELYAGEARALAVQVRVAVAGGGGPVAGVRLDYLTDGGLVTREVRVDYELTASAEAVAAGEVPAFMVAADRARVAHVLSDAAALIKEGDLLEAQALLKDERTRLEGRRDRLLGADRAEVDTLIQLFRDPYVDTDLESSGSAPAAPFALPALVEAVRQGQPVDEARLPGLAKGQLRILRNAPYARHGYRFKDRDLQEYFGTHAWYRPDPAFTPARLTPVDVRNVATLKGWEQRAGLVAGSTRPAAAPMTTTDFDALVDRVRGGEVLPPALLERLSLTQLRQLRNTAYARHGYVFRAADLRAFFRARPWYREDPAFQPVDLGPEDGTNVRQIKEVERRRVFAGGSEGAREFELRNRARAHQVVH